MELQELAKDVYTCLQEDKGLGWSNSGLVNRGGGLVVDTFWDLPHTRELIATYGKVRSTPAQRVVNSHDNGDHSWGNQLFPQAEIIGHRLCAEQMKGQDPAALQRRKVAAQRGDPALAPLAEAFGAWDFSGIEITPPTTLLEDRLELNLDGTTVEIIYVGPAHSVGDVIVHLPDERVVFTGDILFWLCTPIGWDGTFENWSLALDRIVELDPAVVVPGHGPLCGVEGPKEMKAYLAYVRSEAQDHYQAGRSVVDAAKRIDLGPYAGWTEPERIVINVARAYREFQGRPFDAPLDPQANFETMFSLRKEGAFVWS